MNTLPLSVQRVDQEPAFSFLSRLAHHNGLPAAIFAEDLGIKFSEVVAGHADAIIRLAARAGVEPEEILGWTPKHLGDREHEFRGEIFHAKSIKATSIKACPACLRQDIESGRHMGALRAQWMPRYSYICHDHGLPLVAIWSERTPSRRYDTSLHLPELRDRIFAGEFDRSPREPSYFDTYLYNRLRNGRGENWLDNFDLHAACVFCDLLGRAVMKLNGQTTIRLEETTKWIVPAQGYEVALHGEEAIEQLLFELEKRAEAPQARPKGVYGDIYDRLAHDLTSPSYDQFREILARRLRKAWPLGPGDELMGEPVLERRLHSVLTASRETALDRRRLRKLLAERGFVRPSGEGLTDAWELFDAYDAQSFLSDLDDLVSAKELRDALHIPRPQLDLLREDGFLQPKLDPDDAKPLWSLKEGTRFIDDLLKGARPIHVAMHGWSSIPQVCKSLWIRPGEVVRLIQAGELKRIGSYSQANGYGSILVDRDEVERHISRDEAPGMTIEAFAKAVGLKPPEARRLILDEQMPSTIAQNPKRKARQRYISAQDHAAFDYRFITLRGLALVLGDTWQSTLSRLGAAEVRRFTGDGRDYGPVFLWEDLEEKLICRWPSEQRVREIRASMHSGQPHDH
ncbi:TniQ family protein [Roseivivax sediminis]|uniref:TniQ protein n=1 Tax=Roseivivax sediminis TaxID=936889 RepID=A0A1I1V3Y3_9RHOB|nr:TniQ family protein [Roseivivax sediminis]SFD77726.1 TniQ protein [Roseivivax sediminis]